MENMVRELLSEDEKHALKVSELCDTIDRQIRPFPWGKDVALTLDPEAEKISRRQIGRASCRERV